MTYASCIASAVTLLTTNVPSLVTVKALEEHSARVPPTEAPAVLMDVAPGTERRLAGGIGGYKESIWWLDMHIWGHYAQAQALSTTATTFYDLVSSIEQTLRANTRMGGTADTSTSSVLMANDDQRRQFSRAKQGQGGIWRHCVLSTKIREVFGA